MSSLLGMLFAYLCSVITEAERRLYLARATRCIHLFCVQLFKTSAPGPGKIISVPCNLASFEAVRTAGATLRNELPNGIDVLVNNAGIMGVKDEATVDGYDIQMQTSMQLLRTLTHCACAARQPPR